MYQQAYKAGVFEYHAWNLQFFLLGLILYIILLCRFHFIVTKDKSRRGIKFKSMSCSEETLQKNKQMSYKKYEYKYKPQLCGLNHWEAITYGTYGIKACYSSSKNTLNLSFRSNFVYISNLCSFTKFLFLYSNSPINSYKSVLYCFVIYACYLMLPSLKLIPMEVESGDSRDASTKAVSASEVRW